VIPDGAVEAVLVVLRRDDLWELSDREEAILILEAAAPHLMAAALNDAAADLAGEEGSLWTRLYGRFVEQDGGDLSSDSVAYLNGVAEAMKFLHDRAKESAK
jgi:hypothetical protein